jgi:hypothetical protein
MYAVAGVDGSLATIWAPGASASGGDFTVDLGSQTTVSGIAVTWTDAKPASSSISTSLDGTTWSPAPHADATGKLHDPVSARYVKVSLTKTSGAGRTGIEELTVT